MRDANEIERAEIIKFYKDSTEDDYEGFTIGVVDSYVSDCPGYVGPLYVLIGGYPGAFQLLGRQDGRLISFQQECAF